VTNISDQKEKLRREVIGWLSANVPPGWRADMIGSGQDAFVAAQREWFAKLVAACYATPHWPKAWPGGGRGLAEQKIIYEEIARADAPRLILFFVSLYHAASTLVEWASEAQAHEHLSGILRGDIWCQGFSEPNAGSDLASIRCRAVLDGDHFVVNGQKVWTSFAQYSQWCILLARTDPSLPKHKGISFLLVNMKTPGITIRPLKQISGESEFNETFFENVRIPVENLVGELNGGWKIAMTTLAYERGPEDALGRQIRFKQELDRLLDTVSHLKRGAGHAIDDPVIRQKLAKSVVEIEIMRLNCMRAFSKALKGVPRGPEASMMKLYWSHVTQGMYETALEALGPLAPLSGGDPLSPADGRYQLSFLHSRAFTIYSGSSEIQRNIIAERVLGLPK
jgi:alkylation response protein AidB-like acyl-CoA dehydrogenase